MIDPAWRLSRRGFVRLLVSGMAVPLVMACGGEVKGRRESGEAEPLTSDGTGRLTARPGRAVPSGAVRTGLQALGLDRDDDAVLYVPERYRHDAPAPLVVLFHGAGGDARIGIDPLLAYADAIGALLLATRSRDWTWDMAVSGRFGADIALLERALQTLFARYAVDPARIAVGGFSDGASYALSVGLTNGDLFSAIMAFSPGFLSAGDPAGQPRIFISHGTKDIVLPIEQTSRVLVPQLEEMGYEVCYVEFDGLHSLPDAIVEDALNWWLNGATGSER